MTFTQAAASILFFFGGLGVFLIGLSIMSDNLEKIASNKLRKLFEKLTDKKLKGVAVGAGTTAIIQSSSASTVILIGFVNAGLLTLKQAIPVIMGANIGTTVTAFIMALPFSELLSSLGCIGAFILMFSKNQNVHKYAYIAAGLGAIFVGLIVMSKAMVPFRSELSHFFEATRNPIFLILIGMLFTALIQSSSATTGILIAMASNVGGVGEPTITIYSCIFVILGVNIGTTISALLASIGLTSANAKRTAIIHLLFNVSSTMVFVVLLLINPIQNFFIVNLSKIPSIQMQIAVFHIIFNVVGVMLLLPFTDILARIATSIVPNDKIEDGVEFKLKYINELILNSPSIAVSQVKKEIAFMLSLSKENFIIAIDAITNNNLIKKDEFAQRERHINFLNRAISTYLVKISSLDIAYDDEVVLGSFYHVVSDIERIGDYAENVIHYTMKMQDENITFSQEAIQEINDMYSKIMELLDKVTVCFVSVNLTLLNLIESLESSVDLCKKIFHASHIQRLNEGKCSAENGALFISLISNMERIADHMTNIAHSIKDYAKLPHKVDVSVRHR